MLSSTHHFTTGSAWATAITLALAAPVQAGPTIVVQPLPAAVGSGAGVSFRVVAQAGAHNVITGYIWKRDLVPVAQGLALSSYAISAVGAQHVGNYTVEVTSLSGNVTSAPATLTLASPWAQLGGRTISSDTAQQQPALSLCGDRPRLAWVQANAVGNGELRVSSFIGTGWVALGGVLNVSPTADAAEPSIECSLWSGTPQPVVAWSEGSGNQRAIQVKAWNGSAWVAVGGVPSALAANSRKPVLRLAPTSPAGAASGPVHARSALVWLDSGSARAKWWNGSDWQLYTGGFPAGTGVDELALALDRSQQQGSPSPYPPLVARVSKLSSGRTAVGTQANLAGWASLGQASSPISPATSALRITGIGYGSDTTGAGAVVVWAAGSSTYAIGSSQLLGNDYTQALLHPLNPQPAWAPYAHPYTGNSLNALSFDPRSTPLPCPSDFSMRLSHGLAVNDARGTTVLTTRCNRTGFDPLDWAAVAPAHPRPATALSLKLEPASQTPVFAAVEAVGGRYELSVWRAYP